MQPQKEENISKSDNQDLALALQASIVHINSNGERQEKKQEEKEKEKEKEKEDLDLLLSSSQQIEGVQKGRKWRAVVQTLRKSFVVEILSLPPVFALTCGLIVAFITPLRHFLLNTYASVCFFPYFFCSFLHYNRLSQQLLLSLEKHLYLSY